MRAEHKKVESVRSKKLVISCRSNHAEREDEVLHTDALAIIFILLLLSRLPDAVVLLERVKDCTEEDFLLPATVLQKERNHRSACTTNDLSSPLAFYVMVRILSQAKNKTTALLD